ncbi:MAG: hypothetical protein HY541_07485 [Deltaproteobacteria bacterium]|nr:hypothetical protein [Deltaproteobacteria bacterium]
MVIGAAGKGGNEDYKPVVDGSESVTEAEESDAEPEFPSTSSGLFSFASPAASLALGAVRAPVTSALRSSLLVR